jgi:hypothetical protein
MKNTVLWVAAGWLFLPLAVTGQALVPFKEADAWGLRPALWGYRDAAGKTIIAPQYRYAKRFQGPYAVASTRDGFGLIDRQNQVVIPFHYDLLDSLAPDRFLFGYRAQSFGEYRTGVLTVTNEVLLPARYRFITFRANCYLTVTQRDSAITEGAFRGAKAMIWTYGLFSGQGQQLLPNQYQAIRWLDDSLLVANTKHEARLFSRTGQALTRAPYTSIGEFKDGLALVWLNQRCGFINRHGQVVIPVDLEFCEAFEHGVAMLRVQQQWGAINRRGQTIIPPRYSYEQVKAKLRELRSRER